VSAASLVLWGALGFFAPTPAQPCTPVPRYEGGSPAETVCAEALPRDVALLDLGDDWAPRIFSQTADRPSSYRAVFTALANETPGEGKEWDTARQDRYYELFGIPPNLSVLRGRLLDEPRHACHAAIDDQELIGLDPGVLTGGARSPADRAAAARAITVVQAHLRCEGLLDTRARPGALDQPTREALIVYERKYMLPSRGPLDAETLAAFATPSRELDFRALLRALRERVVDATGLIEDGSALNAWEPVLGRYLDAGEYRTPMRPEPLARGAPDLVSRTTEAAAVALGWTSPEASARALARGVPARGAVRIPALPSYHQAGMRLRAEIDRGGVRRRPTFVLYAETPQGEIPLVRWTTTVGGWQPEQLPDGTVERQYKRSPIGRSYWRYLMAAPAWFPPPTTPDGELVRRRPDGSWTANDSAVGPGYRSAYGLMALLHQKWAGGQADAAAFADFQIRTHGSGNYRSILRGTSHGCHRLFNHLAIRLGGFLLAHENYVREGAVDEPYRRLIRWKGRSLVLKAETRGYRYELVPPVPVDVIRDGTGRSPRPGLVASAARLRAVHPRLLRRVGSPRRAVQTFGRIIRGWSAHPARAPLSGAPLCSRAGPLPSALWRARRKSPRGRTWPRRSTRRRPSCRPSPPRAASCGRMRRT
jgi:hypothetical protein